MYKNILFGALLFLFAASPAYAVSLSGVSGYLPPFLNENIRIIGMAPDDVITGVMLSKGHDYTNSQFCMHADTVANPPYIAWSDLKEYQCTEEPTVGLLKDADYWLGVSLYNPRDGYYGVTSSFFRMTPYAMNSGIQASATGLLDSMVGQLFRVIIIGVGIVGGVIVTLFGLRWLIRFVRGNLHG